MSKKSQENVFLASEGDKFHQRNTEILKLHADNADTDPTISSLQALDLEPNAILEIGCGNGWRLEALRGRYRAKCHGTVGPGHSTSLIRPAYIGQGTASGFD